MKKNKENQYGEKIREKKDWKYVGKMILYVIVACQMFAFIAFFIYRDNEKAKAFELQKMALIEEEEREAKRELKSSAGDIEDHARLKSLKAEMDKSKTEGENNEDADEGTDVSADADVGENTETNANVNTETDTGINEETNEETNTDVGTNTVNETNNSTGQGTSGAE